LRKIHVMARYKYKYNPQTLNYEKVSKGAKDYLLAAGVYVFIIAAISAISIFVFNTFVENPKERALRKELEFAQNQISELNAELDTLEIIAVNLQKKDDEIYRSIFGADPYPEHLRRRGIGGSDRFKNLTGYQSSEQVIETKKRISRLQRSLVAQSKSMEEIFELAASNNEMLQSIPAIQPINNKDLTRVASGYGYRIHPIYKIRKLHTGMDFSANVGTEIYATGDGEVVEVEKKNRGYGYHIVIQHGYGYQTLYGHMSEILVRKGQKVKRGEVIGLVGNTGTSVAPHLHYEVIKEGEKVNPANYYFNDLTPEQYEELLEKSKVANQSFD
ncbi:MAG: M23 family metallopeptidase, partial [Flavobacteriales bacterium]|nr:M23 family metallopeptidase [Flavobacteriales bacterium]